MSFFGLDLQRLMTIVRKELLVLLGNRVSRFMIIVPPLVQLVVFGWAATMEVKNVHVGIVNDDAGIWSREIIHQLEGSPTFTVVSRLDGHQEIAPALDAQKFLCVLVFDEEFSRNLEKGQSAEMQVLMDGRRSNAAQIANSYISQIAQTVASKTTAATQLSAKSQIPAIDLRLRSWFNPNLEFQWYFLPNLIGIMSLMIGLIVTGLSVAKEREGGTFDQLLVSPATPTEIALAKLVPGGIIGLCHGSIFLLLTVFGFGVPFNGSVSILYLSMLVFACSSSSIGLMVSSLSATQQQAFLGAFTIGVPCILISGAVTPLDNMPQFLQLLSRINPLTYFTIISQGVFLKDISLASAMYNLLKIALISGCSVCVAIWMFRRRT